MKINARGTKGFLEWMRSNLPRTYAGVKNEFSRVTRLQGLGLIPDPITTASETAPSSSWAKTLQEVAQVAAQVYLTKEQVQAQNRVLNMQLQRAQQNLPPLDINLSQFGLPQPSMNVGMDPDTKQFLMIGGIAAAALFLFSSMRPRARS